LVSTVGVEKKDKLLLLNITAKMSVFEAHNKMIEAEIADLKTRIINN
jgi:hypothetical protein